MSLTPSPLMGEGLGGVTDSLGCVHEASATIRQHV